MEKVRGRRFVWGGHSCPPTLTTKSADRSVLSLASRSNSSRGPSSNLRRLRPSLRKERNPSHPAHRPRRATPSLRSQHPSSGPRRHYPRERRFLPRRRSRRYRRHPPLPGKQHRRNRAEPSHEFLRPRESEGAPPFSRNLREGGDFDFLKSVQNVYYPVHFAPVFKTCMTFTSRRFFVSSCFAPEIEFAISFL